MEDPQSTEWIAKWQKSGGAERANYQLFLTELCDVLGVPHPDPTVAEEPENAFHHLDKIFYAYVISVGGAASWRT
jgi:hypothetical protein